jgi:hypothetical protein
MKLRTTITAVLLAASIISPLAAFAGQAPGAAADADIPISSKDRVYVKLASLYRLPRSDMPWVNSPPIGLMAKVFRRAVDILLITLTSDNIAQYEADLADPAAVYADATRKSSYLKMYGNTCCDTRDRYVNFPWSSENHR